MGPPVSTSYDFDESIFGPLLCHKQTQREREKELTRPPELIVPSRENETLSGDSNKSFNTVQRKEAIMGPITVARHGKRDEQLEVASNADNCYSNEAVCGSNDVGKKSRVSTFEKMMESLEKSIKQQCNSSDLDQGCSDMERKSNGIL